MAQLAVGDIFGGRLGGRGKRILQIVPLTNGWTILKTENSKSKNDFRVRTIYQTKPRRKFYTPKHAHFAIDLYGKLCFDHRRSTDVVHAIAELWNGSSPQGLLNTYAQTTSRLPGYSLEYILHAMNWILEQEDINFTRRPAKKQSELDQALQRAGISVPPGRFGSQLAISLFADIARGIHPVEALMNANLDVLPRKRAFGAV